MRSTAKNVSVKDVCIIGLADAHTDTVTMIKGQLISRMTKRFQRNPHGRAGATGKQIGHTGAGEVPFTRLITAINL